MAARGSLAPLDGATYITDGGMETTLIFRDGLELPDFASFVLLEDEDGRESLRSYYAAYAAIAARHGVGIILDTPTWRANADWGARLGYSQEALDEVNRRAVRLLEEIRAGVGGVDVLISGCVGPRGDGYSVETTMTADEAESYHEQQVRVFADTAADLVSFLTVTYPEEAIGFVRAAEAARIPAVVSFTVETDGRLPDGTGLREAVLDVDEATGSTAAYYMINCAHPTHFEDVLDGGDWLERVRGLRANASRMSHAELDESEELDDGDPLELAADYERIRGRFPSLNVVGGCCGTDERHVEEVCAVWTRQPRASARRP
jgi:S-methylmethionine-dependent homocysteine/selenocysteine methylase